MDTMPEAPCPYPIRPTDFGSRVGAGFLAATALYAGTSVSAVDRATTARAIINDIVTEITTILDERG